MRASRSFLPSVWTAFFISGTAGLVYEVVWARYLDLVLGGTTYAHTMVLAAYMGGLALGAWFFGRLADRVADPLKVYAFLELAIGAYGLIFPLLFSLWSGFYLLLAPLLGTTGVTGVLNKFITSVLLLAPSTFLMGGTLPLLTRAVTDSPGRVGRRVAGLYFINSLGAVGGSLVAGFALIPGLGMRGTLFAAAGLNVLVGAGIFTALKLGAFGAQVEEAVEGSVPDGGLPATDAESDAEADAESNAEAGPVDTPAQPAVPGAEGVDAREFTGLDRGVLARWGKVATWGVGLSGMVVMVYEVAWIRLLSTVLGSTTYSFTLMLAAFITGIALGSLIARWLSRFERPFLFFGASQLLIGVTLLLALPLYSRLPYLFLNLQSLMPRTDAGYRLFETSKYLFCLLMMLLPTLASGAALPLATDVAARLRRSVGQPVGRLFAINTLGTIVGALAAGLVLLPTVGVEITLEMGITINTVFGLWVLSINPGLSRRRRRIVVPATMAALILLIYLSPAWDLQALALGPYHTRGDTEEARETFAEEYSSQELVYYREDVNGTVAVLEFGGNYSLVVNGKTDASTYRGDQITQILIAAIPAMMMPDAGRALVIGLGSGQTAGHLLRYPVGRVEIVEISSAVVEASRYFDSINGKPLDDPRTTLLTRDAKALLLADPDARYDLILSEPSNPWIAGIGGLFSLEYFNTLREHLEPGGIVAQWIHAYQQTTETLGSVFLTFHEAFPYTSLWSLSPGDLLLVGSASPIVWNFAESEAAFRRSGVAADLERILVNDLFTLLNRQMLSPRRVAELTSLGGPLNTDNMPYLEYRAPKASFLKSRTTFHVVSDERHLTLANTGLALQGYLDGREPTGEELSNLVEFVSNIGTVDYRLAVSAVAAWQEVEPGLYEALRAAERVGIPDMLDVYEDAAARFRGDPQNNEILRDYAQALLSTYDVLRSSVYDAPRLAERARQVLARVAEVTPGDRIYYLYELGKVAYDQGRYRESVESLRTVLEEMGPSADPDLLASMFGITVEEVPERIAMPSEEAVHPGIILELLGHALMKLGEYEEARDVFEDSYRLDPANPVSAFYYNELSREPSRRRFIPSPGVRH